MATAIRGSFPRLRTLMLLWRVEKRKSLPSITKLMKVIWGLPLGLLAAGPLIAHIGYSASAGAYAVIGLAATLAIGHRWRRALWHRSAAANANL